MKHVRLLVMFSETFHAVTDYEFYQIDKETNAPNVSLMLNGDQFLGKNIPKLVHSCCKFCLFLFRFFIILISFPSTRFF